MNFELDPSEVLMHLHELGYHNVSPQMLEAFIEDLKKLIKYDITKKKLVRRTERAEDTSSTLPNTTDESPSPSSPPPPSPVLQRKQRIHCRSGPSSSKGAEDASYSSTESLPPTRRVLRECTKLGGQRSQDKDYVMNNKPVEASKVPLKPSKSCDCMWRRIGCKCCEENWSKEQHSNKAAKSKENLAPPRPKSSFIRTWHMTGQPRPGCAPHRSDPVTLYHQYQQVWKQQKVPGENNHNDLRWTIRERMLGQEPQPRPLSQASSVTSFGRQRKRL